MSRQSHDKRLGTVLSVFVLLPAVVSSARADTIYTTPLTGSITGAYFGQTFTAPTTDVVLNQFTVYVSTHDTYNPDYFTFSVYQFDNTNDMQIGAALYASPIQTINYGSNYTAFTFTPSITLDSGENYIAEIEIANIPAEILALGGSFPNNYTGGSFAIRNPAVSPNAWYLYPDGTDLAFTADFSTPAPPVIPSFIGLTLLAIGGRLLQYRRGAIRLTA